MPKASKSLDVLMSYECFGAWRYFKKHKELFSHDLDSVDQTASFEFYPCLAIHATAVASGFVRANGWTRV